MEVAGRAEARQAARADLLAAIDAWGQARRVQDWLSLVEKQVQDLPLADREQVLGRLRDAKSLVGGEDALVLLKQWKAPDERLRRRADGRGCRADLVPGFADARLRLVPRKL